jgi:hypothetical protein
VTLLELNKGISKKARICALYRWNGWGSEAPSRNVLSRDSKFTWRIQAELKNSMMTPTDFEWNADFETAEYLFKNQV